MQVTKDTYIVGIGASAGGFEALKKFFKGLPEEISAIFVVIQHLSPHYESNLHKILEDYTSMPVIKVTETVNVKPGHVYVIPEKKQLKLRNTSIVPEDRPVQKVVNLAIDVFFETMALAYGDKSVGIVLSGTGSDGARGVQIIKSRGGVVMVQSPQSASFDSMPTVAITSDSPDYIGSPEVLAKELAEFIQRPELLNNEKIKESNSQRDTLQEIIQEVSAYSGINFRGYKLGTIIRRIEKRMKINHLNDIQEYETHLRRHPKELNNLYRDLLIGVTRFFRDPEVFKSLEEHVIPAICQKNRGVEPIRIWTVGCSTGEEAYTLTMLFDEYISRHNLNLEFKIFATDIDQRAVEIASAGRYSAAIEEDVSPERLSRYFSKLGEYYEVKKDLRKQIIFSKHNLIGDPPFIQQDLITCRNLFIYLLDEVQNKALQTFNYSLKPNGYLLLGATESISEQDALFESIDIRNKIFKARPGTNLRPYRPTNFQVSQPQSLPSTELVYRNWANTTTPTEHYADLLTGRFAPPSLIMNQQEDVLYTTGALHNYLHFPNKRVDLNVYSMLRGRLILVFRNALRQLSGGESSVVFKDCLVENENQQHLVDLKFSILENARPEPHEKLYLVEFWRKEADQQQISESIKVIEHDNYSKAEIENLELELKVARRQLRVKADELETINEEMQSANEELQSANEELQSTNEELQSSNEELQTVNMELKNKVDAVTILHDDINNLFNSTQLAAIFLDNSTNIRKFTPPAKHYFNIRETDIGRPLGHYSYNFKYPDILENIEKVLEQFLPVEHEVEHKDGTYSIMRILPYKTESRQVKGVVITFTDITELKLSNNKLLKLTEEVLANERHLKSLLDHTPDFIVRFGCDLKYSFVNRALLEASGLSYREFIGRERVGLRMLKEDKESKKLMQEVIETKSVRDYYHTYTSESGEKHYYVKLVPEFGEDDQQVKSILSVSTDITQLKNAEQKLLDKNKILSEIYDRMDNFVHAIAHDLRTPMVNLKMLADLFKKTEKEEERQEFVEMIGNSVKKLDTTLNGLIKIIEVANEGDINYQELAFAEVFNAVAGDFKANILEYKVKLETRFEDCPSIRYADVYLNSILQNLLSNAIKYRHPRRKPHILLTTTCTENFVVLTISDNGQGFSLEAVQNSLFKPFKRFHPEASGMGVGLYIIKYMVERNGGKIEVESQVNEGTKFILYLKPYEQENNTAD
ncbi:CheR family methyltransferase [Cesiribacter sp. SM1]|uniref:CheR family methyltransferase n=1 Tax=Cesiribacter sp. SM1 TaxID=2861196 RepID=UPI001CD3BD72|nr:CheR family methyltransferase [Cesiribacter sp. SM1]